MRFFISNSEFSTALHMRTSIGTLLSLIVALVNRSGVIGGAFPSIFFIVALPVFSLAAQEAPAIQPVELPKPEAGTQFIYSDGSWEQIKEIGSGWVRTVNQENETQVQSVDFTYPPFRYESSKRQGTRKFSQAKYLLGNNSTSLWPLAPGKITRFVEDGESRAADQVATRYEASWQCEVKGAKQTQVAAGDFYAWEVGCNRYRDAFQGDSQESVKWLYAPAINHWISETRENDDHPNQSKKELVAVLPDIKRLALSTKQFAQLQKQFQEVLEQNSAGEEDILLTTSDSGLTSTLKPLDIFTRADNSRCRRFTQRVQNGQVVQNSFGLACRSAEGIWKVPRN